MIHDALWMSTGVAALLSFVAAVQTARPQWLGSMARAPFSLATATLALALVGTLAGLFLMTRLEFASVFFYTSSDLAWPWRLVGTWASREGSFLVWAAAVSVAAHLARKSAIDVRAQTLLHGLAGLFLVGVFLDAPFSATPPGLLQGSTGNGLAPSLRSAYMLIHPPMVFAAYAATSVPAVLGISGMFGNRAWSSLSATWVRWAWILTTAAMGLGALWAYTTLGFGGYWAWDPVEVSNLLPWLALTVLLHVRMVHERHGDYARAGPLLAVLPFLLTLAATVSTRSGLWVSVHAFTDPTNAFHPDALVRLLAILDAAPHLHWPVGALWAGLFGALAAWSHHLGGARGARAILAGVAVVGAVDPRGAFALMFEGGAILGHPAYVALGITAGLVLLAAYPLLRSGPTPPSWGVRRLASLAAALLMLSLMVLALFHLMSVNGWNTAFYETNFPLLALPVLAGLSAFAGMAYGRRVALALAVGVPLGAWLLARAAGPGWILVSSGLVLAVLGAVRIGRILPGSTRQKWGGLLLLLAAVLDVAFWTHPPARLGPLWIPQAPASPVLLGASAMGLAGAALQACGAGRRLLVPLCAGLAFLVGYGLAPILVLAAFFLLRRSADHAETSRPRLRQVAIQGVHIALALALVGYALSTSWRTDANLALADGETAHVGGWSITYRADLPAGLDGRPTTTFAPAFLVVRDGVPTLMHGHWEFHRGAQAHLAVPEIRTHVASDLYLDLQAAHVAPGGPCPNAPEGRWINAFEAQAVGRLCTGDTVDQVRVRAVSLPGLSVLWGAWVLGLLSVLALTRR